MGSREEREGEKPGNVRQLTSDDALPRFCVAETADPRRFDLTLRLHRIFLSFAMVARTHELSWVRARSEKGKSWKRYES